VPLRIARHWWFGFATKRHVRHDRLTCSAPAPKVKLRPWISAWSMRLLPLEFSAKVPNRALNYAKRPACRDGKRRVTHAA
jgi:hypothetical protein